MLDILPQNQVILLLSELGLRKASKNFTIFSAKIQNSKVRVFDGTPLRRIEAVVLDNGG